MIVLSLFIGGAAGIIMTALTGNYLIDYATQLSQLSGPLRLSEERPRPLPDTYLEAIQTIREVNLPTVVQLSSQPSNALQIFEPNDVYASGTILTSDGWILSTSSASPSFIQQSSVIVNTEVYEVEQVVVDNVAGVVFIKIDARNLPVSTFGDTYDLEVGDRLFLIASHNAVLETSFLGFELNSSLIDSTELPSRFVKIAETLPSDYAGAMVVNAVGELIGVAAEQERDASFTTIQSINTISSALNSLLRDGEIERAYLGLEYLDLAYAAGISEALSRGYDRGVLVRAVLRNGPAYVAGVEVGDIILEINNLPINSQRSLSEYVFEYKSGDTLVLLIDREGEQIEIETVLSSK